MTDKRIQGYKLLHLGQLALAEAERNGMRVDTDYLWQTITNLASKEEDLQNKILETEGGVLWKRKFGNGLKFGSDDQLAWVLFNARALGLQPKKFIDKEQKKPSMDKEALRSLDAPITDLVLEYRKNHKMQSYMAQIARELNEDHFIRPFFNLHRVVTYRSSSDSPNFQNLPIRDPEMGQTIRRVFIPREGHVLVEVDYGGLEVRIACCYHQDPVMIRYLKEKYDMHREWAAKCFRLDMEEVTKAIRFFAKNCFVFPEFYGDYWKKCAGALWHSVKDLKTESGVPMSEHFKQVGWQTLNSTLTHPKTRNPVDEGAFDTHIFNMERVLWDDTFPVYRDWKLDWKQAYHEKGYIDLLTGFRIRDILTDNDVINYPVQGAAFHCLLWSFIVLTNRLKRMNMRTKLIGQIHDSIVADVPIGELEQYLTVVDQIMTQEIRDAWTWIIVPLEVEAEACQLGQTWFDKKEVEIKVA